MTRRWVVELPPSVDALLQQCRLATANEQGSHVDDANLIELLCRDFLAGSSAPAGKPSRPAHRIVIQKCDDCARAWQEAPGRRATRNLDVHHIIRRADGGDHDPANLIVLCAGHHKLHHRGLLSIRGRAPDRLSFARDGKALVDARSPAEARATHQLHEQARPENVVRFRPRSGH